MFIVIYRNLKIFLTNKKEQRLRVGQPLVKFLQLYDVFGRHVTNTLTTYRKHSAQHHFWLTDRRTEEDPLYQTNVDVSRALSD